MFSRAIVRAPSTSIAQGLTSASLGAVDYVRACEQHQNYVDTLKQLGLEVIELPAVDTLADAVFVEDVALVTPEFAVLTLPGAPTRQGEVEYMRPTIESIFDTVEHISAPGTLEAGDVMLANKHFYIGLSDRTNKAGADQLIDIVSRFGYSGSVVDMSEMLHLKTGVNFLDDNRYLVTGEFVDHPTFSAFDCIEVAEDEAYAANSLYINGTVLVPAGFPKTLKQIQALGYTTIEVDTSEFRKIDGGLSCLSLRF